MVEITSKDNEKIKNTKLLLKSKVIIGKNSSIRDIINQNIETVGRR